MTEEMKQMRNRIMSHVDRLQNDDDPLKRRTGDDIEIYIKYVETELENLRNEKFGDKNKYRTKEDYAERYAQTYHVSVEEAKQTAAYREFAAYVDTRVPRVEEKSLIGND